MDKCDNDDNNHILLLSCGSVYLISKLKWIWSFPFKQHNRSLFVCWFFFSLLDRSMFGVTMSIFNAFRSRKMCKPPWVTHDYNYFIYDLDWFDGFFIGVKLKCSFQIPEIWFQLFYYQNGIKDKICWCTNHVSRSSDSQN